jgi:hypothetical protein
MTLSILTTIYIEIGYCCYADYLVVVVFLSVSSNIQKMSKQMNELLQTKKCIK